MVRFTQIAKIGGLALCLAAANPAHANLTAEQDPVQLEFDSAFQAMLDNPADVDTVLQYSRAATAAGDYESAIGALERLLMINADQPVVRADLGLLYYRLESYAVAKHHLGQIQNQLDRLPAGLRKSVQRTLGRLDKKITRHSFSGLLSVGLRYQSNANAGPDSNRVLSNGLPILLNDDFTEQDDVNASVYGRLRHQYDLRTNNQAELDTVATLYATRYGELERLDTLMLEISPGVRFKPAPADLKGLTVRPHLLARMFQRDGDRYSDSYGVGLDANYRAREGLNFSATAQYRDRDYNQSSKNPNLNENDGDESLLRLAMRKGLWRGASLMLQLNGAWRDTRRDFRDSDAYGLLGRLTASHAPLFGSEAWLAHVSLGLRNIDYDGPDPTVDPTRSRHDRELRATIGTTIPVSDSWKMRVGLSHSKVNSNIRNYDRNNTALDLNAVLRF